MQKNRGFTIIELMIVIVVVAIAVAVAIPSFTDLIERKATIGAAEAAYEQLQRARSQALKRSKPILVDFNVNGTNWAIGFTDKMAGCDAEDAAGTTDACDLDYDNSLAGTIDTFHRIQGVNHKNITMSQSTAFADPGLGAPSGCTTTNGEQACFDFVRGLARTGAYDFASNNYTLRVSVTQLGHILISVPAGARNIAGY